MEQEGYLDMEIKDILNKMTKIAEWSTYLFAFLFFVKVIH